MTTDAPPDSRFLDGDALRVARVKMIEKAFGIALTEDESARCSSPEETTAVFAARLGAVEGPGSLRAGALAAVREALRDVVRVDSQPIDETTPLAALVPRRVRARRWRALGRGLHCKLPPLRWRPAIAGLVGPVALFHSAFLWVSPRHPEPYIVVALFGLAGIVTAALLLELPGRMASVEKLVTWLVAQRPAAYRGGTDWTNGQVAETVDAAHGLRFSRPGCRRVVNLETLSALLTLVLAGTSLALCVYGLAALS